MIILKLEEKNAKELLNFLLNQKAWLEKAINREKEEMKKLRYENTLRIINPLIDELQRLLNEKIVKIVCKKCGWNAELRGFSIDEKERILKFWSCPNNCGKEYYSINKKRVNVKVLEALKMVKEGKGILVVRNPINRFKKPLSFYEV